MLTGGMMMFGCNGFVLLCDGLINVGREVQRLETITHKEGARASQRVQVYLNGVTRAVATLDDQLAGMQGETLSAEVATHAAFEAG